MPPGKTVKCVITLIGSTLTSSQDGTVDTNLQFVNYKHHLSRVSSRISYRMRSSSVRVFPAFVLSLSSLYRTVLCDVDVDNAVSYETGQAISNWSSTHSSQPKRLYEPLNELEVVRVLKTFSDKKEKIRPVGTALSPNGIGLSDDSNAMISIAALDKVVVDVKNQTVTVGGGAKVSTILNELKKYNLTLENFSSIQEQQIGGWTQVAAHGTGCRLPTVEQMIIQMKIATPSEGIITLSNENNKQLFEFAKVGLGSLGIVTELTLKCIPSLNLHEQTFASTRSNISIGHNRRLSEYRHVRYMWIPYTTTVVGVVSNPIDDKGTSMIKSKLNNNSNSNSKDATNSLVELLHSVQPSYDEKYLKTLSFAQLRDILLDIAPLDLNHVKRVNQVEALFWEKSVGERVDDSTNILGFDCGGEQFVFEVCFPIGKLQENSGKDIEYVQECLKILETAGVPAPSPIEQRWTASSSSPLSPAYSSDKDDVFSWVGIIMYLPPSQTNDQRKQIESHFKKYCELMHPLLVKYNAKIHWAKIELPDKKSDNLNFMRKLIRQNNATNVDSFNRCRKALDPNGVLSNRLIETLFDE